jgi:hypothetical protein
VSSSDTIPFVSLGSNVDAFIDAKAPPGSGDWTDVLERSILAVEMNGEALPAIHP